MTARQLFSHIGSLTYAQANLREGLHLVELLTLFRELKATENKDRLFAFWGLASGGLPAPDYEPDDVSIFVSIARWILESTQDLLLLAMGLRTAPGLPSWVPNFAENSPFEANYWRRRLRCLEAYDCSKGIEWSMRFERSRTLCLQGIVLDRIAEVSAHAAKTQIITSDDLVPHSGLLQAWRDFALGSSTSDQHLDEFCETMLAGCVHQCRDGTLSFPAATDEDLKLCKEMLLRMLSGGNFDDDASKFVSIRQAHRGAVWDRVLFRTRAGRLGLGPANTSRGDEVWALAAGAAPFILRQAVGPSECSARITVGHAYVHGVMRGEATSADSVLRQCRLV